MENHSNDKWVEIHHVVSGEVEARYIIYFMARKMESANGKTFWSVRLEVISQTFSCQDGSSLYRKFDKLSNGDVICGNTFNELNKVMLVSTLVLSRAVNKGETKFREDFTITDKAPTWPHSK